MKKLIKTVHNMEIKKAVLIILAGIVSGLLLYPHPANATVVGVPDQYTVIDGTGEVQPPVPEMPQSGGQQQQQGQAEPAPAEKPGGTGKTGSRKNTEQVEEKEEKTLEKEEVSGISSNTVSEDAVEAGPVSTNTVSENRTAVNGRPDAPAKQERKREPETAGRKEEPAPEPEKESKHILGTILVSYLIVMSAAAATWVVFLAPILYYRDEEGAYRILCPVAVCRGRESWRVRIPAAAGHHGNPKLVFRAHFVRRHTGERLEILQKGDIQQAGISESVVFAGNPENDNE